MVLEMTKLDHRCRNTCSGWQQGFERGAETSKKHLELFEESIREDFRNREDALKKERDEAKQNLLRLENGLRLGGEKHASKTVAFKYMIEERDKLRAEVEEMRKAGVREVNRVRHEMNQDALEWSNQVTKLQADLKLAVEALERLEAGFAGMFGSDSVSFETDARALGARIVSEALASLQNSGGAEG